MFNIGKFNTNDSIGSNLLQEILVAQETGWKEFYWKTSGPGLFPCQKTK